MGAPVTGLRRTSDRQTDVVPSSSAATWFWRSVIAASSRLIRESVGKLFRVPWTPLNCRGNACRWPGLPAPEDYASGFVLLPETG